MLLPLPQLLFPQIFEALYCCAAESRGRIQLREKGNRLLHIGDLIDAPFSLSVSLVKHILHQVKLHLCSQDRPEKVAVLPGFFPGEQKIFPLLPFGAYIALAGKTIAAPGG